MPAGVAASGLVMETDLASFGRSDSEVVQGRERVIEEFDRSRAAIRVSLDAGEDGNVFTATGLARLDEVGGIVAEQLAEGLREAFAGVEDAGAGLVVTSDALIIAEMAAELRDFQLRSIAMTLVAVLLLLTGYHAIADRRPVLADAPPPLREEPVTWSG